MSTMFFFLVAHLKYTAVANTMHTIAPPLHKLHASSTSHSFMQTITLATIRIKFKQD